MNSNDLEDILRDIGSSSYKMQDSALYKLGLFLEYHNATSHMNSYDLHHQFLPATLLTGNPSDTDYDRIFTTIREKVATHDDNVPSAIWALGKADLNGTKTLLRIMLEIPLNQEEMYQALIALDNHAFNILWLAPAERQIFYKVRNFLKESNFEDERLQVRKATVLETLREIEDTYFLDIF